MYVGQQIRVGSHGFYTGAFLVKTGVKQEGILSPVLFWTYMVILALQKAGFSCFIGNVFVAALAYAVDQGSHSFWVKNSRTFQGPNCISSRTDEDRLRVLIGIHIIHLHAQKGWIGGYFFILTQQLCLKNTSNRIQVNGVTRVN
jgi:hypothetical protein